jgi:hypothetical protein
MLSPPSRAASEDICEDDFNEAITTYLGRLNSLVVPGNLLQGGTVTSDEFSSVLRGDFELLATVEQFVS